MTYYIVFVETDYYPYIAIRTKSYKKARQIFEEEKEKRLKDETIYLCEVKEIA